MTREEIIQKGEKKFPPDIIEEIREDGSIVQTDVNATVRHAYIQGLIYNNCQLPSDIDEAELKYVESMDNPPANQEEERIIYQTFKAGAEWMAEQGETIFDTIVIDGQGQRWLTDNLLLGDYDCGEEVIVQIRKK